MTDSALVTAIKRWLKASPFHGEGHRKVWAPLRFEGIRSARRTRSSCRIRSSCRRVLRLMREHGLLAHQRVGKPRGSKAHDGTIITERVDEMSGTDMTACGEGQAAMFIAVDHCSAECTGIHASRASRASRNANRFEALEPVKQAVRERFGAFAKNIATGLKLRHDHGSQDVSHDFQNEIAFLGLKSSPAPRRDYAPCPGNG